MLAKQELDDERLRELGGRAPATVPGVEGGLQAAHGGRQPQAHGSRQRSIGVGGLIAGLIAGRTLALEGFEQSRGDLLLGADVPGDARGCILDLLAPLRPGFSERREDMPEGGQALSRAIREVRATEEGSSIRGQEDAHGPAALAGQRLDRVHVDGIDVRALLAVDLDGHEVRVEVPGGGLVLERLALHHVAPVAGGVADGQEDGPVQLPGTRQRLVAPGVPVHGVMGVLEEVRARLAGQPVGVAWSQLLGRFVGEPGVGRCVVTHGSWPW